MKKLYFVLVLFLMVAIDIAQTPTYFNSNVVGGNNSIPFNSGAQMVWRRAQFCITPGSMGTIPPGNNITVLYFQAGSAANVTYPNLRVRLKTGTAAGMTGVAAGPFESGMTQVFHGINYQMITTTGGWVAITLQTPFLYDPTLPLIVDFEHDHTGAAGPTVCHPVGITGPGNGRQWGDNNGAPISGIGTQRLNFGIDVLPATPCSGTPGPNTVVTPTAAICPNSSAMLSLANTYSFGGITYQWQYSNVSAVGPWTNVPNGNSNVLNTPSLSTVHYFNTIITCTNTNGSVTASPGTLNIAATTTNNVYYFEGFEGIGQSGKLPNCSWNASHPNTTCFTYTNVQNQNRSPRTGQNYASFYFTPAQSSYFWTNEIWMDAGVTYSASMWYKTEVQTNPNWQLRMWTSPAQTTTNPGANQIATTGGPGSAAAPSYVPLSNTFVVTSSGYYHVGIHATSTGGTNSYLSWDDLEVKVPCELNPVSLSINSPTQTICSGNSLNLTANGADFYSWNTGPTSSGIVVSPFISTTYAVTGTVALTGCVKTESVHINVLASPAVNAVGTQSAICAGNAANLLVIGNANSYLWNNNATGTSIFVSPANTTGYTVTGTSSNGCTASSSVNVLVNPLPAVSASGDNSGTVCEEDVTILSANGALTYQWAAQNLVLIGNPVNVSPNSTAIFTVTGTDAMGCSNTATVELLVANCVGVNETSTGLGLVKVFPNPNNGLFTIELNSSEDKTIEVSDVSGKKVLRLFTAEKMIQVDLNKFSSGVYFIRISSEKNSETIKILKQ